MKKGLILGRFQPFHLGHLRLIEAVKDDNLEPIICIGSAQKGRTKDNPFTTEERRIMVEAVVSRLDCEYRIYEIPDVNNNDLYVSHLETFVPDFDTVYSGNSLVLKLFKATGYRIVMPEMVNRDVWEGAAIRQAMMEGDEWETAVPPQIVDIIHDLNVIEKLQNLA
jgi:nicotinamide-nucleotide adenylyltransferase